MTAAALYARFSAEKQNPRSVADQLELCRRHAAAKGWTVVAEFSDAAISGAAMANRPGLLALLAAAAGGAFQIVLVEDTDRLARNREHDAHVFNRLSYAGVTIATPATDKVTVIESALKGLMNELYLVQLGEKTHRGMAMSAEAGKATGSRLYGYKSQPGGAIEIVEAEASVVRRIFAAYAGGATAREIAAALNDPLSEDGAVRSPRGGHWTASQVGGSRQRGNGVLHTELYAGVKVWNRMLVKKNPTTGRRLPVVRPPAEWKRTPVPQLRIVDEETWDKVQARKAAAGANHPRTVSRRKGGVFAGLLRCGLCGGAYTAYGDGRLICAAHREKGAAACGNARTVSRRLIETRVLEGLRTRLAAPAAVAHYVRAYHAAARERARLALDAVVPLRRRVAELDRQIERHLDEIEDGSITPRGRTRLVEREAEHVRLSAELAALESAQPAAAPITLNPRAADHYAQLVATLQAELAAAAAGATTGDASLVDAVRALVLKVEISPRTPEKGAPIDINLVGDLARFLDPPPGAAPYGGRVVAGGGFFRPPTSPLPFHIPLRAA